MSLETFSQLKRNHSKIYKRLRQGGNSVSALQTLGTIPDDDAWKVID